MRHCINCSIELNESQTKHCSPECRRIYDSTHTKTKNPNKPCVCCGKLLIGKQENYCSRHCLGKYTSRNRVKNNMYNGNQCKGCDKPLLDTQRMFCSNKCKCAFNYKMNKTEHNKNSYAKQRVRGIDRKKELIEFLGGKCNSCGYDNNLSALSFHHINPVTKLFSLEMRELAMKPVESLYDEVKKCKLLCANCHFEEHNPTLSKAVLSQ